MLRFGSRETREAWVAALPMGWRPVRADRGPIKRRVIARANGPKNSGRRPPFVKRKVPFADWSGLEIRLVSDPP